MKFARLLCCVTCALLPLLASAQTASTRDGSRVENARDYRDDQASPGKSENAKGKKGEAPGQEKKSNGGKDKNKSKDKK